MFSVVAVLVVFPVDLIKYPNQKQLRRELVYFCSQLEVIIHNDRDIKAAEA